MSRVICRYAWAIALASLGRVDEAEDEQATFLDQKELAPETGFLFQNASR